MTQRNTNGGRYLNAVKYCKAKPTLRNILSVIGSVMDFRGHFNKPVPISQTRIARETGYSLRTVFGYLKAGEETGYIKSVDRRSGDGARLCKAYVLTEKVFDEYEEYLAERQAKKTERDKNPNDSRYANSAYGHANLAQGIRKDCVTLISPSPISPSTFPPDSTPPPDEQAPEPTASVPDGGNEKSGGLSDEQTGLDIVLRLAGLGDLGKPECSQDKMKICETVARGVVRNYGLWTLVEAKNLAVKNGQVGRVDLESIYRHCLTLSADKQQKEKHAEKKQT